MNLYIGCFLILLVSGLIYALTYEETQYWMATTLPGVDNNNPETVNYYMNKLNEMKTSTQPTTPPPPSYFEKEISHNETHVVIEVHDNGTVWNKTKTIQPYVPTEVIPSMTTTEQSALDALEARVKLLEDKLLRLCAMNITGAC